MCNDAVRVRRLACAWGAALALLSCEASALFIVNQPWLRPALSGQPTRVYMNLTSTEGATLVAVRAEGAGAAVIRGPGKTARTLDRLPLPAKALVALAPGKEYIALNRLVRSVKLGDRVALTLTIEAADGARQDIAVDAEARLRSPIDDERRAHSHAHPH